MWSQSPYNKQPWILNTPHSHLQEVCLQTCAGSCFQIRRYGWGASSRRSPCAAAVFQGIKDVAWWSGLSFGWEPRDCFPLVVVMSSGGKPGHPTGCGKPGVPLRDSHGSVMAFWENAPGEQPTPHPKGTFACPVTSSLLPRLYPTHVDIIMR